MTRFTKSFICRLAFEGGLFTLAVVTVMQMLNYQIKIDINNNIDIVIVAVPVVVMGIFYPLFMVFLANHNTRVIRRAEYRLTSTSEYTFYRRFAFVVIGVNIVMAVLVYTRSMPFFKDMLDDAIWRLGKMNYTTDYYYMQADRTNHLYDTYVTATKIGLVVQGVICALIMLVKARKMVAVYQQPDVQSKSRLKKYYN